MKEDKKTERAGISLDEIQNDALEKAENELESYKQELEKKKYLVDLKGNDITSLLNYITHDAPWKFTEALGIIEVINELKECVSKNKLFMTAISIEALYFYLSKVEGKGTKAYGSIGSIEIYIKILKSINVVRNIILTENEKLKELEFIVASRKQGIVPDSSLTDK